MPMFRNRSEIILSQISTTTRYYLGDGNNKLIDAYIQFTEVPTKEGEIGQVVAAGKDYAGPKGTQTFCIKDEVIVLHGPPNVEMYWTETQNGFGLMMISPGRNPVLFIPQDRDPFALEPEYKGYLAG